MNYYAIILAGGGGTRLWPLSRASAPKQVLKIVEDHTLLEATYKRLRVVFPADHIIIVTTQIYAPYIYEQLGRSEKYIVISETKPKGTAAAIGLGVAWVKRKDSKAIVVTINSDAFVKNEKAYCKTIRSLPGIVRKKPNQLTLVGIKPEYPETGYGYIECKKQINPGDIELDVQKFVEKPDIATANKYVKSGKFLWNPTMIVGVVDTFWNAFEKYLPNHAKVLVQSKVNLKQYTSLDPISIDYGILEHEPNMRVVVARSWGWSDIGHWKAVKEARATHQKSKIKNQKLIEVDGKDNLIFSQTGKLIALVGMENVAVVETDDAILVCNLHRAQEVKKVVEELKKQKLTKYL